MRQPQHLARERETFGYLFCPHAPYGSQVSLIGEEEEKKKKKKKKKKKRRFLIFQNFIFSTSIKLSRNQRTYLYSGGLGLSIDIHFVDLEVSYDILSSLPIVLSKHFNHPHPHIEIATAISDNKIARFILKGSINILYFVPKQNTDSTVTDSCINACYRVNALTVIGTQRHSLHKVLMTLLNNQNHHSMQNTVSIGLVLTFLMVFSFLLAYVAMRFLVVGGSRT